MNQSFKQNSFLPPIKHNVDLTSLNTLGVRSIASAFIEIKQIEELQALAEQGFFRENNPFILGGGSNILLKDDVEIPVLKISIEGIKIEKKSDNKTIVVIGAGENWHKFVEWAVEKNLGGIENLALIPGTVGAAPIQNIGAYGVELSSVVEWVEFFDLTDENVKRFNSGECKFGYRASIFKSELRGKVIVTQLALRLSRENHKIVDHYYALKDYFKSNKVENPGIKDVFDAVIDIRKSKLPDPSLLGNAGSFFKNPIVNKKLAEKIRVNFDDMPSYKVNTDRVKIPAGWLIEKAGWKGKKIGNVGTYKNQALVIVNHGGATGEEIYNHAMKIQRSVKKLFGIELTPEVNIVS